MDATQDWQALGAAWRGQEAAAIDPVAIAAEVRRRGHRLRFAVWAEVFASALMVVLCAGLILRPDTSPLEAVTFAFLAVALAIYQGAVLWLRRRQLGDAGIDPAALVDLELRRLHTTRRYWRLSAWTGVGLWVVLYAVVVWHMRSGTASAAVTNLGAGMAINVVAMPLACAWAWWRSRTAQRQLARFAALRRQLQGL